MEPQMGAEQRLEFEIRLSEAEAILDDVEGRSRLSSRPTS